VAAAPDWTLDELREHLQAAVELELLVIPPYLCALYSLVAGTNLEAALVIRSVVVEEMLHMILAANVLNAVGGTPAIGDGGWAPRYPAKIPYHAGHFAVHLRPYDNRALDAFLTIENPSYLPEKPVKPPPRAGIPRLLTLGAEGYPTIGAFYTAIRRALKRLDRKLGHDAVFTGHRARQIGPEHYYASGGRAQEVYDLKTADTALDEIVEQGEAKSRCRRPVRSSSPAGTSPTTTASTSCGAGAATGPPTTPASRPASGSGSTARASIR
jgi:hypothetical protein